MTRPSSHRPARCLRHACVLLVWLVAAPALAQDDFITFESGPVRPVALSPDGETLFVVNTPDNRLGVFDVGQSGLRLRHSIAVGMEPVAVAVRTNDEVWVVNHLSDSVSVVDLASSPPHVARTLLVGDEPRDIVFAGTGGDRAFVTTAHRGQHRGDPSIAAVPGAGEPQLTTPGIGRADVWVFDATSLGSTVGGTPVAILTFFADTPRGLAATPDGGTVYVAAFLSGNRTTAISEALVPDGFDSAGPSGGAPGGVPGPATNANGDPSPETGLIVKFDGADWDDTLGRHWNGVVAHDLPDHDVFSIDANTLSADSIVTYDGVGTVLFNMAVNPTSGKVYVTNTELPNHVRFQGPGDHGGSTVQGRVSETRITILDPTGPSVDPNHLNQHIDYSRLHTDTPDLVDTSQIDHSLATPLQPVFSSDGSTVYVPAYGSARIGVFAASAMENPSFEADFDPTLASADALATGGGPAGLAVDESRGRIYVLTRFDNAVSVIALSDGDTLQTLPLHNPEPVSVVQGRPFLYDATTTSGNGEASCASCHVFGDVDGLAWNLGDPDASLSTNPLPSPGFAISLPVSTTFHPMKGPMVTQTLRGLSTHGAMHWRGDRADGFFGTDSCTSASGATCSENLSLRNFIVAFEELLGKDGPILGHEVQSLADFVLQIRLPPSPVRNLDGSETAAQAAGRTLFFGDVTDTVANCSGCHELDPAEGLFGTRSEQAFNGQPQTFKVPHLRNLYTKVGAFLGAAGDQVRGFGFQHDGAVGTIKEFLGSGVFSLSQAQEQELEEFALAFPTDLAPIVGQQVTLTGTSAAVAGPRIDLLIARAAASFDSLVLGGNVTECDLVVKGSLGGVERGWVLEPNGLFRDDTDTTISDAALRALAGSEGPLTYTCGPPGSGNRMGIDRDRDLVLDGLDNCPAVPNADQADQDGDGTGDVCEAEELDWIFEDGFESGNTAAWGP